jgi:quinohemoprotein ethanol dehydrogenase
MLRTKLSIICVLLLIIVVGCNKQPIPGSAEHIRSVTESIDQNRLMQADLNPEDWISYGKNYSENRYSILDQINASNVDTLGLVWGINLETTRGNETTPIVVDGIMYLTGPWSIVYAIDVRKGEVIWIYDPEVPRSYGEKGCCGVVNRGVAIYEGMLYLGAFDGRLICIDAVNGEMIWEKLTVDQKQAYTITGAPRIIDGKVVIGNGGAEYGVRGYLSAFDAFSGEQVWRTYLVPGDPSKGFESEAMEKAAETWTGEWWKMGGGGTAWDAMAYDPDLNLLYVGTGNGTPWDRELRSPGGGDNLYLSSILALNPDNGELIWYYQTTPGDSWDYTATQSIILADLEIEGTIRKVLMQAPKNGFFYVLDRTNGDFISAKPYVYTNWAKEIDQLTGRPVESEFARYNDANTQIAPSGAGGHNWHPMAYNSSNGLVYIPAREDNMFFAQKQDFEYEDDGRSWNTGTGWNPSLPVHEDPEAKSQGKLIAWDPVAQEERWSIDQSATWNGGILACGDLVFQGTGKGDLKAYHADTGELLWEFPLKTGIVAPPVTYMVDGIQYISIATGWGGGMGIWVKFTEQIYPGGIYTFALGGTESPPEFESGSPDVYADIAFEASQEEIQHGAQLFSRYCGHCHNGNGAIPNLTFANEDVFGAFDAIVGKGAFLGKGMPNFGDRLSDDDVMDIKNFLLSEVKKQRTILENIKSMGVIGDATEGGWERSIPLSNKGLPEGVWEGELKLKNGEFRFRADNKWELNWGGTKIPEGNLIKYGTNFSVTEGIYKIRVEVLNSVYSIQKIKD